MSQPPQTRTTGAMGTTRAIRRHLADLCLIAALVLVLVVSMDRASASSHGPVESAGDTVEGRVGAAAAGDDLIDSQSAPPIRTAPPG